MWDLCYWWKPHLELFWWSWIFMKSQFNFSYKWFFQQKKNCEGSGACTRNDYTACCETSPKNWEGVDKSKCPNCPKWVGDYCHFCITIQGCPTTTKAPSSSSGSCFPSTAVSLENGNSITMSKLQIGDKI